MDAVTNPAERVSRNGLVLVRLRVPKGTRSVPTSDLFAGALSRTSGDKRTELVANARGDVERMRDPTPIHQSSPPDVY